MKHKFKVGDLIYYKNEGKKNYTVIKRINFNLLWGNWCYDKKEAKNNTSTQELTFMPAKECFLDIIKDWRKLI